MSSANLKGKGCLFRCKKGRLDEYLWFYPIPAHPIPFPFPRHPPPLPFPLHREIKPHPDLKTQAKPPRLSATLISYTTSPPKTGASTNTKERTCLPSLLPCLPAYRPFPRTLHNSRSFLLHANSHPPNSPLLPYPDPTLPAPGLTACAQCAHDPSVMKPCPLQV